MSLLWIQAQLFHKFVVQYKTHTSRLLWNTMWAMIDNMLSSKFMFAPNLCNASWSCASNVQRLFQRGWGWGGAFFSDVGPELWRQTDVCWTPLSGENASRTLRWATIAGAEGKHHPRLSRRYAPLALQQMFRCGRPTAIHFLWSTERAAACTSAEEDQRTQVEQHPSLHKSKHRGRTRKRQARLRACVRIMPSRHLNNGQF